MNRSEMRAAKNSELTHHLLALSSIPIQEFLGRNFTP